MHRGRDGLLMAAIKGFKAAHKATQVNLGKKGSFSLHRGALHRALNVPEGEKIPAGKMAKAAHGSPRLRKMASLAKTLKGMHHADGGVVNERKMELAGDVVPIRPPHSPFNNSGRQGQTKNQGAQSPNTSAPGSNISRIYGKRGGRIP